MPEWDEQAAKEKIGLLVHDFDQAREDGRAAHFSEEDTKKNFILPLFRALGWNVDSSDVSAEERILRGRADYGFKIGGVTKFYLEAKALSRSLAEREYLQQVIDYSYVKGVSWAVLSNFAQTFVLYSDLKTANPFDCRFFELSANEYVAGFDRLRLLSWSAIARGELDARAEEFGRKPRKQPVDKQLLSDLNSSRLDLAKDIGRLNSDLFHGSDQALEETVQRILDRLIFIRVAEDRGLEDKHLNLLSKGPESTAVKRLRELFRSYDENFDSKLFQPHTADDVRIDGGVLQQVVRGLHETRDGSIRYDFGAIDADVLGVMYEQYLGLILRQTPKRAKLADGRVNRKQQGIYYTPTWVVDYIVRFAIEESLKRKGAKADNLRLLDLACGSGTFLLRAFDRLMQTRNPTGARVQSRFDPETAGPLLALRTSVLTDNLFGVDLDARAVEIAQLNLMIRAAESRHRLPTLERNIRVGNSVIADESVDSHALDWAKSFPGPMGEGGFDVVVTNPPYVRIQNLEEAQATYLASRFEAEWNFDLYTTFVQQAWELLREGGVAGFILPIKWVNANYGVSLRRFLAERGAVLRIMDFRDFQVFENATTYTCLLFLRKGKPRARFDFASLRADADPALTRSLADDQFSISQAELPRDINTPWKLVPAESQPLFDRLDSNPRRLSSISESIYVGLQTSADPIYIVAVARVEGKLAFIIDPESETAVPVEKELLRPILRGREIQRWELDWRGLNLLFPYRHSEGKVTPIDTAELQSRYPRASAYFARHEARLKAREGAVNLGRNWHLFVYEKNLDKFESPKLLTQVLADRCRFTIDGEGRFYFVGGGNAGGYGIQLKDNSQENMLYTLGVLNSRPVEFYHNLISTPFRGGFFSYGRRFLDPLPIPEGTATQRAEIARAAKELIGAHARLRQLVPGTDNSREQEGHIVELETELDRLTLELFTITPEEARLLPRQDSGAV